MTRILGSLRLSSAGCLAVTLVGWLGPFWWFADLFSHFRVQLAAAALGLFLVSVALKSRPGLVLAGLSILGNGVVLVPELFFSPEPPRPGARPLQVIFVNVAFDNRDFSATVEWVGKASPELFFILEATPAAGLAFDQISGYQRVLWAPESGPAGMATYARIPVEAEFVPDLGRHGAPMAVRLSWEGEKWSFLALHPFPAVTADLAEALKNELAGAAAWSRTESGHKVVLGDFNSTPWSAMMAPFFAAGLLDSRRGFGLQASWPQGAAWMALLRIPIDHLLHSDSLVTVERNLGPGGGSDHKAVQVILAHR